MKKYYHVTLLSNLNSIMRYGLIPQIGELSKLCGETQSRIYLFATKDAAETAIMNWLGENIDATFGENTDTCLLQITLPDDIEVEHAANNLECYVTDVIPPRYIQFVTEL